MQIHTALMKIAKITFFSFIAALALTLSAAAMADQVSLSQQPQIRYIDRSKGESNSPYSVSPPQSYNETVQDHQSGSPFLWRIEHPGIHSTARSSYIFGTIHIDDKKVMALTDSIIQRLDMADMLMLELELNANGSVDVLRKMLFTDGRNLSQVIGEETFIEVSEALQNTGNALPEEILTVLKPWAAMLLLIKPENSSGTFLDKKLADHARNAGVTVQGLETVNEQLSVFDDIAIEDQVSLLQEAMSALADKNLAYQQLLDAYLEGDMEKLVSIADSQQPEDQRLASLINEKLITERNQRMFERMQGQLRAGNTFIAVGALHLPGKQGLINKLRQAGYRLVRIKQGE